MPTRALVLSGGGSRGAFQAGVIYALATTQGRSWDLVAGVSVGALNGAFMAQHAPAEQRAGATALKAMWMDIKGNKSIYKPWALGYLMCLWKGGLYNTEPLRKMVQVHLKAEAFKTSGVKLRMGAVSYESGEYKYVTEETPNLAEWVMASSAFPVAFPPSKIDGESWIDGGVRDVTPIRDVADEPGVTSIDVILTAPRNGHVDRLDGKGAANALKIGLRTVSLMSDEVYLGDLQTIKTCNVYAVPPDVKMPEPLDFSPEAIRMMFEAGEKVGSAAPSP